MRILVRPGDGIGPQITAATTAVPGRADPRGPGLGSGHGVAVFERSGESMAAALG